MTKKWEQFERRRITYQPFQSSSVVLLWAVVLFGYLALVLAQPNSIRKLLFQTNQWPVGVFMHSCWKTMPSQWNMTKASGFILMAGHTLPIAVPYQMYDYFSIYKSYYWELLPYEDLLCPRYCCCLFAGAYTEQDLTFFKASHRNGGRPLMNNLKSRSGL